MARTIAIVLFPFAVLIWILVEIPQIVLWIAGWPIVLYLAKKKQWEARYSREFMDADGLPRVINAWKPKWAYLWGNEEDGVTGAIWFRAEHDDWSEEKCAIVWSAWRNPVNNLRFLPVLNPVPHPAAIGYVGNHDFPGHGLTALRQGLTKQKFFWSFTWQGLYAGLWIIWAFSYTRHFRLRVGWKFVPADAAGIPDSDYRHKRMPIGLQFTPWRKG